MKIYFKNLDGLRFFAALLVLIHHASFFKLDAVKGASAVYHVYTKQFGTLGVNLFFVLSGFLISYLLMVEQQRTGTVNIKHFYQRRILRIWPLYYFYGISITLLAPLAINWLGMGAQEVDWHTIGINLVFLVLFAVNIQMAFFQYNPGIAEITWSVCIEEQFYMVWPWFMRWFNKRLLQLFVIVVAVSMLMKVLFFVLMAAGYITEHRMKLINYVFALNRLELFGMGMLGAYFYFNRERYGRVYKKLFHRGVQWVMWALSILFVLDLFPLPATFRYFFAHGLAAVLFCYIIVASVTERSVVNFEQPLLRTLGKISYGIYLYHTVICQLTINLFARVLRVPPASFIGYDVIYPFVCLLLTAVVAYASYQLFEKRFLEMKQKIAVIQTRV
ncbi:acyltransferase family protein [Chitinophaga japonensis]|uniref:Peptidoglycan/LPS O-acetylase OafA/YrhL n=1 Tax=Chitinophaga japonensis TaxID=104662 RepID=A0A562SM39_CHIJA|nr:acyltransferase [Chitinophaga japonensis]TWI82405.1 peptidoglycan/LPS O-acetylase OafA/YrhL [Chitinophaga japonensis]